MIRVVARFMDGNVLKGTTQDFALGKDIFHLAVTGDAPGSKPAEVKTRLLKALFFVKDFEGDPNRVDRADELDTSHTMLGRWVRVTFKDGEVLVGTTTGFHPDRPGFFLVPGDSESNIERCYVVTDNTSEIRFL
jgi:hypothetical protein